MTPIVHRSRFWCACCPSSRRNPCSRSRAALLTRGVVHDPERRALSSTVEDEFGYAAVQVVSFEDLFGGKLHAAVDRQHPRPTHCSRPD
ncbi:nucleotidyl transferase AbiEii/AbiGii toxin family protein [Ectothiorhodospira sp. 9100]|uniref:nucleotidyl transferase AbiEii/AbiGii toxin family protein n=1 Tax=unclassified Ectothiorhodospira TaxID=2684909 RepID=UPI0030840B89